MANEHKILTEIDDPYVVKCYDAFETDDKLYLFMELMSGGELFDRIVDMGHFTEAMAQDVTFKLLGSLNYMHEKGIAHRDLKPENMLMSTKAVRRHAGVPGSVQTPPPPSRPPSVECLSRARGLSHVRSPVRFAEGRGRQDYRLWPLQIL